MPRPDVMRKLSLVIHRWVGLALGGLVALLGLTGSLLVYGETIDRALNPELYRVSPDRTEADGGATGHAADRGASLSPGRSLALVRRGVSGFQPAYLALPGGPGDPHIWHGGTAGSGGGALEVFVDPHRGRILGTREDGSGVVGVLFRLHTDFLAGPWGARAVGILGLVLVLLCVTGAVVWWPRIFRPKRFMEALAVRWSSSGRRTNYDLHRAGGAWTLLYLAVLGLTGAGLIFYGAAGDLLNAATGSRPMPSPPASVRGGQGAVTPEGLDRAWASARRALPEATFTYVTLPREPGAPLGFRARVPGELHPNGRSHVWFEPGTGRRLRVDDATGADPGPKLLHALYPVHIGSFALGPVGPSIVRALWALLGLAPALLMATGFLVWWWRRNGRASSDSPPPEPAVSRTRATAGPR